MPIVDTTWRSESPVEIASSCVNIPQTELVHCPVFCTPWLRALSAIMGLCASIPEEKRAEYAKNKQIASEMKKNHLREQAVTKLLLLGAGESGKSTVFKQMKQLYTDEGWSEEELMAKKNHIFENIVDSLRILILETTEPTLEIVDKLSYDGDAQAAVAKLQEMPKSYALTPEIGALISSVWKHPNTQRTYARRSDFQLNDNTEYYLNEIDRIASAEYAPSLQDVLRVRIRTSGIVEAKFKINKSPFRMFDVGGQRNERKKWIHCFDDVTAVIYVVSLSGYDQVCFEDATQNRLVESLDLFADTRNNKWFKNTPFILFLNKVDLFEKKIADIDLRNMEKKWFLNYNGGTNFDAALAFIKEEFASKTPAGQELYTHETTATNTKNVELVFDACKDIFLRRNLQDAGFME